MHQLQSEVDNTQVLNTQEHKIPSNDLEGAIKFMQDKPRLSSTAICHALSFLDLKHISYLDPSYSEWRRPTLEYHPVYLSPEV